MPRSRQRVPRPTPQAPAGDLSEGDEPELSEWGIPADELEDEDDPGEPPPLPSAAAEPPSAPSEGLQALGAPPSDTLAAEKWAHSLLMRQAYETMMSAEINETQRRKEVRTILRDAKGHVTDAARYDYMRLVEQDRRDLENHKRGRASAIAVPLAAPPEGAKIIPLIPRDE